MPRRAFTLIELLITVAIVTLLVAIIIPSVSLARGGSGGATSMNNLRTLGTAHFVYAVDFDGRQLTFADDAVSTYGGYGDWFCEYSSQRGGDCSWGDPANHPAMMLGWGRLSTGRIAQFAYETSQAANASLVLPIMFESNTEYFGSFRLPNVRQFNQYLGGRFYDEVFYAPGDTQVFDAVEGGFEAPDEYWAFADIGSPVGDVPGWSSYCLSPAGMFNPAVMRHDDPGDPDANGWVDPFELDDGFAAPSVFQFTYPALKTHMLEHNWIQNRPFDNCNPGFDPGTYGGCEPYYFNHGFASVPFTLFHDGHVEGVAVERAIDDDATVRQMTGNPDWGLWSNDTPWGQNGYLSEYGYDQAQTSFHVLTTDGAEGRDVLAPGVTSSTWRPVRPRDRAKRPTPKRRAPARVDAPVFRMAEPDA